MSTATDWQRVTALFDELLDATNGERARILDMQSANDAAIVAEVRSLLLAHGAADGRFDKPLLSRLSAGQVDALTLPDPLLEAGRVGAFRVMRKIGEGGMGAVYEATRADASFEQRVAIKTIARGAGSSVIASRFRRERQILAGLQHPNIAGLLDGGVTESGVPYFVMEYVDGVPLDQYCRERTLSITARLDLMQQVCQGVQHAHQRLVVHRDLKPQNIFVSRDGVVKLLDFGIAKLIESSGGDGYESSTVTQDGVTPMTAAYASPEQLRGDAVSTSSDVYSLGVMLYELLTDVQPFPSAGRPAAQIANEVLTTSPLAPSAACTAHAAELCGEGDRARLARRLSGELDAIVMMAMRKEPERRYSSVEALAADIQRYLRGLPVAARPDTLGYRVQRYVQRNRVPVTLAAALLLVATVSGTVLARQSMAARRETARTTRISEFLQAVLGSADARLAGGILPRIGPNATVGALLDSALQRVSTEFPDDPAVRARLFLTIGSSRMAQSRMSAAATVLDSAIALSRIAYGQQGDVFVMANIEAGSAALHGNRFKESEAFARTAERALVVTRRDTGAVYARVLTDLAAVSMVVGDYEAMAGYARRALALEDKRTPLPTVAKGVALNRLGSYAVAHNAWRRADSLWDRSLAVLEQVGPPSNLERIDVQLNRATIALVFGRIARVDSIVQEGLAAATSTYGVNSRERTLFLGAAADLARARGDMPQARALSDEATRIVAHIRDVVSVVRANLLITRANVAMVDRDWATTDTLMDDATRVLQPIDRGLPVVVVALNRGIALAHEGHYSAAEAQFARAEHAFKASGLELNVLLDEVQSGRAYMHDRIGDAAAVERDIALISEPNRINARKFLSAERAFDGRSNGRATPPSH